LNLFLDKQINLTKKIYIDTIKLRPKRGLESTYSKVALQINLTYISFLKSFLTLKITITQFKIKCFASIINWCVEHGV
jgi:hypothetical protein